MQSKLNSIQIPTKPAPKSKLTPPPKTTKAYPSHFFEGGMQSPFPHLKSSAAQLRYSAHMTRRGKKQRKTLLAIKVIRKLKSKTAISGK